ncbi:MAG: ECF-type sigma factor [Dokdonella sp.]|uniref:ECF-type sigma factor n=1 Tax=Dokdonella sp. TaxID=2291710 RepID=UPI0032641596
MNAIRADLTRNVTSAEPGHVTRLLHAAGAGDPMAWNRLVDLVYPEMTPHGFDDRANDSTTKPASLLHECSRRLSRAVATPHGTDHLLPLAVRILRQVLVDHARERLSAAHIEDSAPIDPVDERKFEHLAGIDDALRSLTAHQPRQAQVFECRYFGGLGDDETALALNLPVRTVRRDWNAARAWLGQTMNAARRAH